MARPGLYSIKPRFVRALGGIEDFLVSRRVSPDALTYAAVAVSALAGAAIAVGGLADAPLLWLSVPPLALVRMALNALDGSVARRTGEARPFGTALNEICDRMSDAAMIAPIGLVTSPALALGTLAATFFASTTGILSLALVGERDSSGPMGKADRALVLSLAGIAAALVGAGHPFQIALYVVAGGSALTAALRIARIAKEV